MNRPRIDTVELKSKVSITALIESDLGPPTISKGRWTQWRCPFHAGRHTDDLSVTEDTGTFYCFGCQKRGDAIDWLQEYRKLEFKDAVQLLNNGVIEPGRWTPKTPMPNDRRKPPDEYQERWTRVIQNGIEALERSEKAQRYLEKRGIRMAVAMAFRLGYCADIASLGMDEAPGTGGILLPCVSIDRNDEIEYVHYVKVRRPNDSPKYKKLAGNGCDLSGVFGAHLAKSADIVFVVEGEFDAILLEQEAGDMVGVVTTGGVSEKLSLQALIKANGHRPKWVFAAHDADEAGGKCAAELMRAVPGAIRAAPTRKDITEMHQEGLDLGDWVKRLVVEAGVVEGDENDNLDF